MKVALGGGNEPDSSKCEGRKTKKTKKEKKEKAKSAGETDDGKNANNVKKCKSCGLVGHVRTSHHACLKNKKNLIMQTGKITLHVCRFGFQILTYMCFF